MLPNVGWGEVLIILMAGLIVLGPERLPGAVSWTMKSLRRVREYATGATDQLRDELGPEFEDLRQPLAQLNELRGMTPRAVVTRHLLDGDGSVFESFDDRPTVKPVSAPLPVEPDAAGAAQASAPDLTKRTTSQRSGAEPSAERPSGAERPGAEPSGERRTATPHTPSVADWDAT